MIDRTDQEKAAPSVMDVMRADLVKAARWSREAVTRFAAWSFAATRSGGSRRRWMVLTTSAVLWAWFAAGSTPFTPIDFFSDLALYPFQALFAPQIFRHVIVIACVFWFSLRISAGYMADVFELGDVRIAEKYILQAVFASSYNSINIKDGRVAKAHLNSPIARIGGPGLVKVHLENAALFEKADRAPLVVGPSQHNAVLDRFDRLRAVIDLRDQVVDLNVHGRTKDGIHVSAQGVHVVYSVLRGRKEPNLKQPHPFDPIAIEKIVYDQPVFHRRRNESSSPSRRPSRRDNQSVELNIRPFIRSALKDFIAKSTLSEFLAGVREPELAVRQAQREKLVSEAESLAKTPLPASDRPTAPPPSLAENDKEEYYSRDRITDLFYQEVNDRAREIGLQLHWIDIGTWVLPEESRQVPKQHLEAWKQSVENIALGSKEKLSAILNTSAEEELTRLFREIPLTNYHEMRSRSAPTQTVIREIALAYREKLHNIKLLYEENGETPPEEIQNSLQYLIWATRRGDHSG